MENRGRNCPRAQSHSNLIIQRILLPDASLTIVYVRREKRKVQGKAASTHFSLFRKYQIYFTSKVATTDRILLGPLSRHCTASRQNAQRKPADRISCMRPGEYGEKSRYRFGR